MELDKYEVISLIGLAVWLVSWLPGLFLFSYRASRLLQKHQIKRATFEGLIIAFIPTLGWAGYAWSQTMMQLAAGIDVKDGALTKYLIETLYPYLASGIAVSVLYLMQKQKGAISISVPIIVGLIVAPLVSTAPLFSLLMVIFGG